MIFCHFAGIKLVKNRQTGTQANTVIMCVITNKTLNHGIMMTLYIRKYLHVADDVFVIFEKSLLISLKHIIYMDGDMNVNSEISRNW